MKQSSTNITIHTIILLVLMMMRPGGVQAQQVDFGLYAEEGITLTPQLPNELDFGDRFSGEGEVRIKLEEGEVVAIEIKGVAYLDVTVTVTPPINNFILLEGNEDFLNDANRRIPLTVKMAYYNRGEETIDIPTARQQAVEVSGHMATFQIRRRPGGPPGPPPTPPHAGYTPPTATAYLFLYGKIDVGDVNAGPYSGIIDVHVEYSGY